ncbi:MAG: dosage-dependent DnaK suppressor protein [uncultured bacterium]|uniref:Transcriptional regulator, TraR/DksA family n=1 Tax=Candidatus Uhrbacteria bacterium GW2011_GWC1_41_20 TaxID=1618983 RepID=A0A0G0XRI1_9BACT|nr:MAG: dosage-dependent DnaK suppressor protein [uncultured bacterium]KKR22817.1 MAG: Transcriptional regulator, TraR/DksA family [Candidatus Uhrbacteria bacterium GW2011_GWE1_39_46]KKR64173.1 MAG: Transcriptional regulator, TraR/DksA family [Candidatus Uhrbacteria bacterium GW2011_GWC2_40_450]KKR90045.1 MAG: Transcriptional regulator, TraR/DksA family [Candidatus Uhrbacteria bacterium GW2011_GWE2_41_1153]KKR90308.1 MAG: Transcriptional regulator, TraR/DksA family [Candidatus Uhrbacteria bacte
MNKQLLTEIKEQLEKERDQLMKDLGKFANKDEKAVNIDFNTTFPEYGDDEDENAGEIATYSNNLALEDKLEKELRDVLSSLKKIEKNEYGMCKYCHQEISEERLRARPTSTSCVACKKTLTQEI